ncbi:site-specific DNA-methyltransferase [Thermus scotoductus]|uniref:Methyltransferase n=1 Tax=Thermus scotoductus TaxID=37636 RepID=A0A430UYQ3_THESC|nr:site-specific DNA-methyltransferase [Thermus scotoductus]RTH03861.1 site-specific DNA-methyltransferase [Thermus scotoductus]RTH39932.1 site-specific DNA-methyltransferase [Thermus scotoductus]RTH98832.1 site-specific DNA-methyltransferase [Thermus scotoductus]RTI14651.1 site-specific DNA-methyltransferase [Thermus scotoductus]
MKRSPVRRVAPLGLVSVRAPGEEAHGPGPSPGYPPVGEAVGPFPTGEAAHFLRVGDARKVLAEFPEASVHLVLTSPPYWTLKRYEDVPGQMAHIEDYEAFLDELDRVWREAFRLLVPGGRLIIVVGDVAVARRRFGRHLVFPLHADIQVRCRKLGFDNLNPILWYKRTNASLEVEGRGVFLGKPYEPGAIIKTEVEYILMQRKPGGYRRPSPEAREKSRLSKEDFHRFFRQIWEDIPGESTRLHPAPFPLELAERLVRMFSFVGDTVLDPFAGTGTTLVAAAKWGRRALGVELVPGYAALARERFAREVPGEVLEVVGD